MSSRRLERRRHARGARRDRAALGGFVAAATAIVAVDRLIAEQPSNVCAATVTLAGELDEHRKRPLREVMGEVLDDENEEIATSGIRLAVVEQGQVVAGDQAAPTIEHGLCGTFEGANGRVRACARAYRGWSLVAAQATNEPGCTSSTRAVVAASNT